jgi:hypothetical protein
VLVEVAEIRSIVVSGRLRQLMAMKAEDAVLDVVPLRRARRVVGRRGGEAGLFRQVCQVVF